MNTFYKFPAYIFITDLIKDHPGAVKIPEDKILNKKQLVQAAAMITAEEMIVWFAGKQAVGFIGANETEVTMLDKAFDTAFLADQAPVSIEANSAQNSAIWIAAIYPIELANDSIDTIRTTVPIHTGKQMLNFTLPSVKGLYNSMVANNPNCCLILFYKQANSSDISIQDRLTWESAKLADGRALNATAEIWQVCAFSQITLETLPEYLHKILATDIGAFISKSDSAKLYASADVTRYFQKQPTGAEIAAFMQKHKMPNTAKLICLYRSEGTTAYKRVNLDFDLAL